MTVKLFLLCLFVATTAFAADPPSQFNSTAIQPVPLNDPSRRSNLFLERPASPLIVLGKSDFVIKSPLIEGLRPLHSREDLSRGQKFLRLPIIRMFVPQPMENPPETGRYFAWRDCSLSWAAAASRPKIGKGP